MGVTSGDGGHLGGWGPESCRRAGTGSGRPPWPGVRSNSLLGLGPAPARAGPVGGGLGDPRVLSLRLFHPRKPGLALPRYSRPRRPPRFRHGCSSHIFLPPHRPRPSLSSTSRPPGQEAPARRLQPGPATLTPSPSPHHRHPAGRRRRPPRALRRALRPTPYPASSRDATPHRSRHAPLCPAPGALSRPRAPCPAPAALHAPPSRSTSGRRAPRLAHAPRPRPLTPCHGPAHAALYAPPTRPTLRPALRAPRPARLREAVSRARGPSPSGRRGLRFSAKRGHEGPRGAEISPALGLSALTSRGAALRGAAPRPRPRRGVSCSCTCSAGRGCEQSPRRDRVHRRGSELAAAAGGLTARRGYAPTGGLRTSPRLPLAPFCPAPVILPQVRTALTSPSVLTAS